MNWIKIEHYLFIGIGGGKPPMGGNPGQGCPDCCLNKWWGGKRSLENPGGGCDGSIGGFDFGIDDSEACTRFRSRSSTLIPALGNAGKGGIPIVGGGMGGIFIDVIGGGMLVNPLACKSAMKSGLSGPKIRKKDEIF